MTGQPPRRFSAAGKTAAPRERHTPSLCRTMSGVRRFGRILLNAATVISLVLCAAALVLCVGEREARLGGVDDRVTVRCAAGRITLEGPPPAAVVSRTVSSRIAELRN